MSEQYLVSARKYRPQTFDTVVGQEHITTTLRNAIKTAHLAHAYLFCGPRGVGKTTCARILARTINCENPTAEMEACGVCTTCRSFQDNASFNVFELDAASNNSVEDIRALTEQVRYAPQVGKYKVYIIDEVHMLSSAAFNAFLKTLEEPPAYAIFILATTEKHKILPTILSRCQIFDFKRIQTEDIVSHLAGICAKEHTTAENAALHVIAQKSEGCMRDALSMMDRISSFTSGQISYVQAVEHLNILDADVYFKLTDTLLSKDISSAMLMVDQIFQRGFEGDVLLNGFAEHFRNILLCKDMSMARLLDLPEEHKRIYYSKAQIISTSYILSALNLLNDAELSYRNSLNKRLHVELCLLKLCMLNDVLNIETPDEGVKKNADRQDIKPAKVTEQPGLLPPVEERGAIGEQQMPPAVNPAEQPAATSFTNPATNTTGNITSNADTGTSKKGRIGKGLLENVLKEHASGQSGGTQVIVTQALAEQLLNEFTMAKKDAGEHAVAAHLGQMRIEFHPPEELHVVCRSSINYHFAINQKDALLDFFNKQTGNIHLRIVTTIDESLAELEPEKKHKSKQEIFDEMAEMNPALRKLRDGLNLQLD